MNKAHIKTISAITIIVSLAACGGRDARPVMVSQYGDNKKSCEALEYELRHAETEIQRLVGQKDKTGKNVALGVAGWFFLVPWFFMDFKNAEAEEYEAYRQRYNHLVAIAIDKKCDVEEVDLPSVEEMKEEYEKQQSGSVNQNPNTRSGRNR